MRGAGTAGGRRGRSSGVVRCRAVQSTSDGGSGSSGRCGANRTRVVDLDGRCDSSVGVGGIVSVVCSGSAGSSIGSIVSSGSSGGVRMHHDDQVVLVDSVPRVLTGTVPNISTTISGSTTAIGGAAGAVMGVSEGHVVGLHGL